MGCEEEDCPQKRVGIFQRAESHKWALKYTYKRNYFAAKWVGWLGWALDIFTAVVGAVLIYMLTRQGNPNVPLFEQLSALQPADLAIIILFGSLISSFYGPKLRSRKYYNAGQEHQELYDEFADLVEIEIPCLCNDLDELQAELDHLNTRRHELNQSTPQLGGVWFHLMKSWAWFVEKTAKAYSLIAPWKKTPENLYNSLHPSHEVDDEDDRPPVECQLSKKIERHCHSERCTCQVED